MSPKTIYWLDKNLGRPICFLLTLHRKWCSLLGRNSDLKKKPAKILFLKLIEQGSTVLADPALKAAASRVGRENVYFLVFKENRPILDILDVVSPANIIEVDGSNFRAFIRSAFNALAKMRNEGIDAVIDMEFFSRASAILAYLSRAKRRVGFHRFSGEGPYRGDLFTHKLSYNPHLHVRDLFVTLTAALSSDPGGPGPLIFKKPARNNNFPQFIPADADKKLLIKKVEELKPGALGRPVVIFNPNTKDILAIRRWPEESFIALAGLILNDFPQAAIVITGVEAEREDARRMASRIKGAVSLAGQTSLRELLTLYYLGDVLVTSDSGPAHFSGLTPIKCIALFGPETPLLYGGCGKNFEAVSAGLACSPCLNVYNHRRSPCRNNICLKSIKAEDIYGKVKGFLRKEAKKIEIRSGF